MEVRAGPPASAPIFVAGDSREGMSLSLLLRLRDLGFAIEQGRSCLSPWTDLNGVGLVRPKAITAKNCWFTRKHWIHGRSTTSVARTRVPRISHRFSRSFTDCPALASSSEDEVLH